MSVPGGSGAGAPARSRIVAAEVMAAGALVAGVIGLYALVLGLPGLATSTEPGPFLVGVATVAVALAGRPAHRGLRRWSRRRVGVPAVTPAQVLRRLTDGRDHSDDPERVAARMLDLVAEALQVPSAELWVVVDGRLRPAAWLPTGPPPSEPPSGPDSRPVRAAGETIGLLRAGWADGRELAEAQERLLEACADRAGLILAVIARRRSLRDREAELIEKAAALRASRLRSVDIEQVERRRVERDLHDGAQQQLIALGLTVQLARRRAGPSPARSAETLVEAAALARRTGTDLARLGEAFHDAGLQSDSLAGALRRAFDHGGLTVTVTESPPGAGADLDADSRTALFFAALEAVQNAAKHARVEVVTVHLEQTAESTGVRIHDDGTGFDPDLVREGLGIRSTRRRLGEVGGRLSIRSRPAGGTTVTADVPARSVPRTYP